jgi:hypothetical protein
MPDGMHDFHINCVVATLVNVCQSMCQSKKSV